MGRNKTPLKEKISPPQKKKKKKKKINEQNNSEEVGTSHPLPRGQDGTSAFFKKLCNSPMVWDYILLCPQRGDREIKTLACWEKKKSLSGWLSTVLAAAAAAAGDAVKPH